jgi:endonuclease/exonuclease/phosphatase family metal-dependent hydrolase
LIVVITPAAAGARPSGNAAALTAGHASPASARSAAVPATLQGKEQRVRLMTYNILELSRDGEHEGDGVIAPWSERLPKAAALIASAHPDAIAIEEGSDFVGRGHHVRQVDSLRRALGGTYALAHTEITPPHLHYFRTGVYILYNKSIFKAVGRGGHWKIGQPHWAAYQVLKNRATGAKFLFVATHLLIGYGATDDAIRQTETDTLIRKATRHAQHLHLPLVYAGDFNSGSDLHFTFDAATRAMRAASIVDAFAAAPRHTNGAYNSANQYFRRPKKTHDRIDHIYAPPGIIVRSAGIVLQLRHGRFVGAIPSDHNPLIADVLYPY